MIASSLPFLFFMVAWWRGFIPVGFFILFSFLYVVLGSKTTERVLGWLSGSKVKVWLFFLLLSPGVVAHELSHALMALMMGGKVKSITFFWPRKEGNRYILGSVTHSSTGSLGDFLVGIAPLISGMILSVVVLWGVMLGGGPSLWSREWVGRLVSLEFWVKRFLSPHFYLGTYLLGCFSLTSVPSTADLRGWGIGLPLCFFVLLPLFLFPPSFSLSLFLVFSSLFLLLVNQLLYLVFRGIRGFLSNRRT